MRLDKRPPVHVLPSYSLTGDLLGFLRCGLEYRYTRIGKLPSVNPVQMWFGHFIHGVLEEAYRRFDQRMKDMPWPKETIAEIIEIVKRRLRAQNLRPWSESLEQLGDARAEAAINELGPELFPLIHRAEVRLRGARRLPLSKIPPKYQLRELDRYEMVGVVDVITHVRLNDPAFRKNRIVKAILEGIGKVPSEEFEVILDYKGMRRHPLKPGSGAVTPWESYAWQVQTYAHLRESHEDSLAVAAGVLVYVNELFSTWDDFEELRMEIESGLTDVAPPAGSEDKKILGLQTPKKPKETGNPYPPQMSLDLRLRRAFRVVPVSRETIRQALDNFDDVVARIEICRGKEQEKGCILNTWEINAEDEDTCKVCSSRSFCPGYKKETAPRLPGVRIRM
jgi:hypothetical protein